FCDKLVLTSVTPAFSSLVFQTPNATSSRLYFVSLAALACIGGFVHCIFMDTSVNAANQIDVVDADIAFDVDTIFLASLVRLILLVLILLLMPTLNFLPVWFALSLLRFRLPSRLPMMFILWMVAMMVVIIPSRTV